MLQITVYKNVTNDVFYCYSNMDVSKPKQGVMRLLALCGLFLLVMLSSCSTRIDGVVLEGGEAELSLKASLEPRTLALIHSMRVFMGESSNAPILDGLSISRSMAASSGIRSVSLSNTSPSALEGLISISNLGDFLAGDDVRGRFIAYAEGAGASSLVIALDRDSAPVIISRLPPEAGEYLSALMAPAVLGERSTRQEYLDLLAMVYGRPLADEIAAARILVSLEFPRPPTAVLGGNAAGRRAEFDIPLLDVLVLERPLRYEVNW